MKKSLITSAIAATLLSSFTATSAHASEAELMARIDQLAAELQQIKAELAATRAKTEVVASKQETLTASINAAAPIAPIAATAPSYGEQAPVTAQTVISSYGEISYTRPRNASNEAQTDVGRAVIGISHRFSDATKMVAEFEWEHAVTAAEDQGEAAVEQLYVEHELSNGMRAKAGLYLMPVGLLNTSHEPTAYYGVHRNFVETAIIPTTWREVGLGLSSTLDYGLSWDAGISTGFDLSKWDAASGDGAESPLGSIHQEGQLAKSKDLSLHAAVNWRGIPGLLLGGFAFTGNAGQSTPGFAGNDARITLWDLHARYTPGAWDLSALYSRGTISNTDALNQTFVGQPTPVPSSFYGWYAQAAYQLWKTEDYSFSPFARYEQYNTALGYAALPPGLGVTPASDEKVTTVGGSFKIGEGVVLKADYQKFKLNSARDRFNFGVGYSF